MNLPHETHPTRENLEARIRELEVRNKELLGALQVLYVGAINATERFGVLADLLEKARREDDHLSGS